MRPRAAGFGRRVILKEMEIGNKRASLGVPNYCSQPQERGCWRKVHSLLLHWTGHSAPGSKSPWLPFWSNQNHIFFDVYTPSCLSVLSVSSSVLIVVFLLPPKCFFLPAYGLGCFLNESVLFFPDAITSAADLFICPCVAQLWTGFPKQRRKSRLRLGDIGQPNKCRYVHLHVKDKKENSF